MVVWFNKLPSVFLFVEILLDRFCGLVISHVERWFESLVFKTCKHIIEGCYNSCIFDVSDEFGKTLVGVVIVGKKIY